MKKEFYDRAAEIEAACGDWENSRGLSQETLQAVFQKVEAMEAGEQPVKTVPKKKRSRFKKRFIVILAACLALAFGTGVVGDRAWIADSEDLERDSEVSTKVDNEEKENVQYEEDVILQEITEKLGIASIWLGYKPEGMVLDGYIFVDATGWVYLNYLHQGKLICIQMAKDHVEVSSNVQWDGDYEKIENVSNAHGYESLIEAYCVDAENHNYGANITYGNGYYNIFGQFSSQEEFLDVLDGIYFRN